jgi:hypothetical protein
MTRLTSTFHLALLPPTSPDLFWLAALFLWFLGSVGGLAYVASANEYTNISLGLLMSILLAFSFAPFLHPLFFAASILLTTAFTLGLFIKTLWLRGLLLVLIAVVSAWASYAIGSSILSFSFPC